MIKITFIEPDETIREIEGEVGQSLMELAVRHSIAGIDADCGGACACATCHVYVDPAWTEKVGGPKDMEESMLDFAQDVEKNSRLSCQVVLNQEHHGLIVKIPEYQG